MGRNSRENYDRNIYNQLEETINKVEKMAREMTEMKSSHRREIYLLNEKHELAIKELKVSQRQEVSESKERMALRCFEWVEYG